MQPLLANEPTRAGDYQLVARLGRGAMGGVYLGRSRGGRVVAVKVIRPDLAEDSEFRERFRREADMARSVGGFWTAAVVDADPDAEYPWLATEYVPGPTLHQAVVDHGPLPEATVRALGAGLGEALSAIHQRGLVHRDLKPANVLLGPDGPRVIDFGISRAMTGNALTATGMFLGTPGFFSPEQTTGDEVRPSSDVFSLGAVLVFAATGTGPFGSDNTAALLYRVVHNEPDLRAIPEGMRALLASCLAKAPEARPEPDALVSQLADTTPQGSDWLPPAISTAIAEHTSQLREIAPSNPSASNGHPAGVPVPTPTRVGDPGGPHANHSPAGPASEDAFEDSESAPGTRQETGATREKIAHARPSQTARVAQSRVRKQNPGPVFHTAGRFSAMVSTLLCLLCMYVAYWLAEHGEVPTELHQIFQLGMVLLAVATGWCVLSALVPRLHMKVNSDGVLVSRAWLTRQIPWAQIRQVGIVDRGKHQAVAMWFVEGAPVPRARPWHRVRPHRGGFQIFPLGATGGWWARRQHAKRMRSALQQHAPGRYDERIR